MLGPGCVLEGRCHRPAPSTLVSQRAIAPVEYQSLQTKIEYLYLSTLAFKFAQLVKKVFCLKSKLKLNQIVFKNLV